MLRHTRSIRAGRPARLSRHAAICLSALLAVSCGGGGATDATTPTTPVTPVTPVTPTASNAVTVGVASFDPGSLTVAAGTTVTWTWASCSGSNDPYGTGQTCVSHGVAWDAAGGTNSPTQESGTYTRLFSTPGTYTYHCTVHGAAMSGSITVQ